MKGIGPFTSKRDITVHNKCFNLIAKCLLLLSVSVPLDPGGATLLVSPAYADGDGGDGDGGDGDGGDGGDGDGNDGDDGGDDRDDGDDGDDGRDSGRTGGGQRSQPGEGWVPDLFRKVFRSRQSQGRRAAQRSPTPPPPLFAEDEIVSLDLSDEDAARLISEGYVVLTENTLTGFEDARIRRFEIPSGVTIVDAVNRVRTLPSGAATDLNHFYRTGQSTDGTAAQPAICDGLHCGGHQLVNWPSDHDALEACFDDVVIGMIDTGLNAGHETFDGASLSVHRLSPDQMEPSSAVHGTAVAAVLIGSPQSRSPGLLPGARLVAVDTFHRAGGDERSDLYSLLNGLSFLAEEGVGVINLSLAGPANALLERAVTDLANAGIVTVAATGNAGARAAPLYPAAYEDVIAVTAVDRRAAIYRRAVQGTHVEFSAPGVEVWTAASIKGARPKTGTSFATPFVTGAVALVLSTLDDPTVSAVRSRLVATSRDLGDAGHDPVYGHGLISLAGVCEGPL